MRLEDLGAAADARLVSPSAERNKISIGEVLATNLPERGVALEIASGTGQHVAHFARVVPTLTWQPSERDADCLRSISAWLALERLSNVLAPLRLDVDDAHWPICDAVAVICINMTHITPWSATQALIRGAQSTLTEGGVLYIYGPFRRQGLHTSSSNRTFDAELKATNPAWGVRDLGEISGLADAAGFDLSLTCNMPANNLSAVFRKRAWSR